MICGGSSIDTSALFMWSNIFLERDLDNNLNCDLYRIPEDVPVYMGHSSFNTTKCIIFFIVQSLLHRNPPNIWIKIIKIMIQFTCLHRTKLIDPYRNLDRNPDNFALYKWVIGLSSAYFTLRHY